MQGTAFSGNKFGLPRGHIRRTDPVLQSILSWQPAAHWIQQDEPFFEHDLRARTFDSSCVPALPGIGHPRVAITTAQMLVHDLVKEALVCEYAGMLSLSCRGSSFLTNKVIGVRASRLVDSDCTITCGFELFNST